MPGWDRASSGVRIQEAERLANKMDTQEQFLRKIRNEERERLQYVAQAVFPNVIKGLRPIAKRLGYSLAVHGSQLRDCDLVACPWVTGAADPSALIETIKKHIPGVMTHVDDPASKPNGRLAWCLYFWCDDHLLTIDISVMPSK